MTPMGQTGLGMEKETLIVQLNGRLDALSTHLSRINGELKELTTRLNGEMPPDAEESDKADQPGELGVMEKFIHRIARELDTTESYVSILNRM